MTEGKICPIMSKPKQGDIIFGKTKESLYDSETEMKQYGWTPIDGTPWSEIFPCLQEKCMAWIPECQLVDPKYKDAPGDCMDQIPGKRCKKQYRIDCQGYCKLIERG
jgi:hypothetical protein